MGLGAVVQLSREFRSRHPGQGCSPASTPGPRAAPAVARIAAHSGGLRNNGKISKSIFRRKIRTRPRPLKPPCAAAPLMAEEKDNNPLVSTAQQHFAGAPQHKIGF